MNDERIDGNQRSLSPPGSLFERLNADDEEITLPNHDDFQKRISSIKRNLSVVLNARQGGALSAPDYGLSDLNDANVGSADMLRKIAAEIRNNIVAYEPRVENVQVRFDRSLNDGTEFYFTIKAYTRIEHKNQQVSIDLVLNGGGSKFVIR